MSELRDAVLVVLLPIIVVLLCIMAQLLDDILGVLSK